MGWLAESLVIPNAVRIAGQLFPDDPPNEVSPRLKMRKGGGTMELDVVAAGSQNIMIVEAKNRIKLEHVDQFLEKLKGLAEYYPEYANHKIFPVLASVDIPAYIQTYLTERKVYGLAFADETMELINLGRF